VGGVFVVEIGLEMEDVDGEWQREGERRITVSWDGRMEAL
jgi:hypothetical protein